MKPALIVIFALFQANLSQSQNLYLTASNGYNFGSNRAPFKNYTYNKWVSVVYPYEIDRCDYSLGKGTDLNLGLGYTMKNHIGFELEGSYLLGIKTTGKSQYIADDVFKKEIWGRFYRLNPSVNWIYPMEKFSVKMSFGGLFGFGKMHLNQEAVYKSETWMLYENEFSGGVYWGFNAGIGMLYPINDRLNLGVDISWVNAYYSPARARITKYMDGPNDNTNKISVAERESVYSNSVESAPYNPDMPSQRLKENFAASSIGLQVGIQWNLWTGKKEEDREKTDKKK